MKNVTIRDIAREAHVSVGTVSKYINGRTDIREKNRRAIGEAIARLGYSVNLVARTLAHKPIRIGVLLPSAPAEYFVPMEEGIQSAVCELADHKVSAVISRYQDYYDDRRISEAIEGFISRQVSGMILAPARQLSFGSGESLPEKAGIPSVLVVSDTDSARRLAYVGIDAALSGRTAADLTALLLSAQQSAAILIGSRRVTEHAIKADSYLKSCEERGLRTEGCFETRDDPAEAYRMTAQMIRERPSLRLIYVATGNSIGVCRAIEDAGRTGEMRVIATDLPRELEPFVRMGLVTATLNQHLREQGHRAVRVLYRYLTEGAIERTEIRFAPELLLKSAMLEMWHAEEKS